MNYTTSLHSTTTEFKCMNPRRRIGLAQQFSFTFFLERSRTPAIVSEDHQHGLLALVVVASGGKAHQLHVYLAAPQGLHYHLETMVVALIHHPGANLFRKK